MVVTSKVTSKHQATIPSIVRKALGIQRGDAVAFEIEDGIVTIAARDRAGQRVR